MKITLEVSEKNEATAYPWWMIVDPPEANAEEPDDIHQTAGRITGPFFSRVEAELVLASQRYNFSARAGVYCASGHETIVYREAIDAVGRMGGGVEGKEGA